MNGTQSKENSKPKQVPPLDKQTPKVIGFDPSRMDENNKKACEVLLSQGPEAAVKYMFTHPKTEEKMDYATMRSLYG